MLSRAAHPAIAGLLAVLLLVSGTLSVSHALHHSLHSDEGQGSHICLVCSLAKGQVDTVAVATAWTAPFLRCLSDVRTAHTSPPPASDYRLSPSRAPPAALSSLTAAA
ncbi:MAG: hypothetical protein WCL11_10490 [Verrucomicrobiota bacterium]